MISELTLLPGGAGGALSHHHGPVFRAKAEGQAALWPHAPNPTAAYCQPPAPQHPHLVPWLQSEEGLSPRYAGFRQSGGKWRERSDGTPFY